MRTLFLYLLYACVVVMPAGARNAVMNPLSWSATFSDTAYLDRVEYVYFVAEPEQQTQQGYTGDTVFYAYDVTDSGSCTFTLNLTDASSHTHALTSVLYHDVNMNGAYERGVDTAITNQTFPVLDADGTRTLLVGVVLPDDATIPDSLLDTTQIICASNTNPSWKDTLWAFTTVRVSAASQAHAFLDPDTTVVDSATVFTYRIVPLDGAADEFAILNPFTDSSITVTGVSINTTSLTLEAGSGRPTAASSARWEYLVASNTLKVLLTAGRVQQHDTLNIVFSERMGTVPVAYASFFSSFSSIDTSDMVACQTATGDEWDITVMPGIVHAYTLVPQALSYTAGVAFVCTLTAFDAFGNIATSYDTTGVAYTFAGPGVSPDLTAPVYATSAEVKDALISSSNGGIRGRATLSVTLYQAETVTLTLTDVPKSISGTTSNLYIRHNAYDSLSVTPEIWASTADDTSRFVATAFDHWNNQWNASDSVAHISWGATGSNDAVTQGWYHADSVGSWKIWATYSPTIFDTASLVITHGATDRVVMVDAVTLQKHVVVTADDTVMLKVTAYDTDENWWIVTDSAATTWLAPGSQTSITSGAYSADSVGIWQITATYLGYADVCTVEVVHGEMVRFEVTPASAIITADTTLSLTATGFDANSNAWEVTLSAHTLWRYEGPLSNNFVSKGLFDPTVVGAYNVFANFNDGNINISDTSLVTVNHGITQSVSLVPASATITADDTLQMTFTATDADGNNWLVNDSSATTWLAPGIPDAVQGGKYSADTVGTWNVVATYDGFNDACVITVNHGAMITLKVTPPTAVMSADNTLSLVATGFDADDNTWVVTADGFTTWGYVGAATSPFAGGNFNPQVAGNYTIFARYNDAGSIDLADTSFVTVLHGATDSLSVTPPSAAVTTDDTVSLTVRAFDVDKNYWDVTDTVATTWFSPGSAPVVAQGNYVADTVGVWHIVAGYDGLLDTCIATVRHGATVRLDLAPATAIATADDIVALVATAYDAHNNSWDVTDTSATSWITGGTADAVVLGNYVADTVGTWSVIAVYDGVRDTARITTIYGGTVSLSVTPATGAITADHTLTLVATAADAAGNTWNVTDSSATTWHAPGSDVALVAGVYQADTVGTWPVHALYDTYRDTCMVSVAHGTLTVVTVLPTNATITTDSILHVVASGFDADGNTWNITDSLQWGTNDASVTIHNGAYNPDSIGSYLVWAETTASALLSDTASITVLHGAPVALNIFPFRDSIIAGDTLTYTVMANDADSVFWDVTALVTFVLDASLDSVGARITGTVTHEHYRIRAVYGSLNDTASLKITPSVPHSMQVYVPAAIDTVQAGGNTSVAVHMYDRYNNTVSDTCTVTWSQFDWGGGNAGGAGTFNTNTTATVGGNTQVIFTPSIIAGDNFGVVATHGSLSDTSFEIYVKTNTMSYVVILNAAGNAPFGDTTLTTDNDATALSVMGYDAAHNELGLQNGTWRILDDSVGVLTPLVGNTTVLTANNPETCRVEVTVASIGTFIDTTGYIIVTVGNLAQLVIAPDESITTADGTIDFDASGFDADGNPTTALGVLTWSDGTDIGVVQASTGILVATTVGYDSIRVTSSLFGVTDITRQIRVKHGVTDSISLIPQVATLSSDSTLSLTLTAFDADKNQWDITDTAVTVWTHAGSQDTITAGVYTADTVGTYTLTATYDGITDSCVVHIKHGASTRLVVVPVSQSVTTDQTITLLATAYDADNNFWDVTDTVLTTWRSPGSKAPISFGVYQADSVGVWPVWALYEGLRDTCMATVTRGATVSLALTPSVAALTSDGTYTFTATAFDADTNSWVVTSATATSWWTTGTRDTIINGVYGADTVGVQTLIAGYDGFADTATITVTHGVAVWCDITPNTATMSTDDTIYFVVTAHDVDSNAWDVTSSVLWDDDDFSASVTGGGIYAAQQTGSYRVWATYGVLSDTSYITVGQGALAGITMVPATATRTTDQILSLTVIAEDADSNTWDITDTTFGTVWGTDDVMGSVSNGIYTMNTVGTYHVWVHNGGYTDTCVVTVNRGNPVWFDIRPDTDSITADDTIYFSATVYDADSNALNVTATATWGDDDPSASVTAAGVYAPANNAGYQVWATYSGLKDTSFIYVAHGAIKGLTVTPVRATQTTDDVLTVTAEAVDAHGNTWDVTDTLSSTIWTTDDPVGVVSNGIYIMDTVGSYQIIATNGGYDDTCVVAVQHGAAVQITVVPGAATISADDTVLFTATAFDADGNAWNITDTAITAWAYEGPDTHSFMGGVFLPQQVGTYRIYTTYTGRADTSYVTVAHGVVTHVILTPAFYTLTADETLAVRLTAYDADHNSWVVTDSLGTVWDAPGSRMNIVAGVYYADTARVALWLITGSYGGFTDTAALTVRHGEVMTLAVQPTTFTMTTDTTLLLTATAYDTDNNAWMVTDTAATVWTTTEPGQTILAGVYAPDSVGVYAVVAAYDMQYDTCMVTVGRGATDRVVMSPAHYSMTADDTLELTFTAYDTDNNSWDVTNDVTTQWRAPGSHESISAGVYRADTARVAPWFITGTYDGLTDTAALTVRHGVVVALDVQPTTFAMTTDMTLLLTATAYDADSNAWMVTDTTATVWTTTEPGQIILAGVYAPDSVGVYAVVAAYDTQRDTCMVNVGHGATKRVVITPHTQSVTTDDTLALTLRAYDADNNSWQVTDVSNSTVWHTNDPVGTVVNAIYTADTVGVWQVWGVYDGYADTCVITSTHGVPVHLSMTPTTATIIAGGAVTYVVTAFDANNIRWDVSDSGVFNVSPDSGITLTVPQVQGIYRRDDYTVVAQYASLTDTSTLHITANSPDSVYFTYPSATVSAESVIAGDTVTIAATVRDQFGNKVDTAQVAWTWFDAAAGNSGGGEWLSAATSVSAGGFATVDFAPSIYAGDRYRFSATMIGNAALRDTSAELHVVSQELKSIRIVYTSTTIPVTDTVISTDNDSMAFMVVGFDALNNPLGVFDAQWTLEGDSVGLLSPLTGTVCSLLVTTPGVAWLTATVFDTAGTLLVQSGSLAVTVGAMARLELAPVETLITADDTFTFSVQGYDADENLTLATGVLTWSGGAQIGTIDALTGVFTAQTVGTDSFFVISSLGLADTSHTITVVHGALDSLVITPAGTTIIAGDTLSLLLTAYDADLNTWDVTDSATWGVVDSSINIALGVFMHQHAGSMSVWAQQGLVADTVLVYVVHAAVESVVIAPATFLLTADDTLALTVYAYDQYGNTWEVTDSATGTVWELDRAPAGLLHNGRYEAVTMGRDTVIATYGTVADSAFLTISHGALTAVMVAPHHVHMLADSSLTFVVTAHDADANVWDITSDSATIWTLDDTSGVLNNALYNPALTGDYTLVVRNQAEADTVLIAVRFGAVTRIDLMPDSLTVNTDTLTYFSVVAYDDDNNARDYTTKCMWSSSDTSSSVAQGIYDPQVTSGSVPWFIAASFNYFSDTAYVTVVPGAAFSIDIVQTGTERAVGDTLLTAGDSLLLTAVSYDAKGNSIGRPDVDWTVNGSSNLVTSAHGPTTVFIAFTATPACSIQATLGAVHDLTGHIIVQHADDPAYYGVQFVEYVPAEQSPVLCSLYVFDAYDNLMTRYNSNANNISISVRSDVLGGLPSSDITYENADKYSDIQDGYIQLGGTFNHGVKRLFITYSATEESLWFTFTDDITGVTGTSKSVVWKNPNIVSFFYGYPNPFRGGQDNFKIHYVLRDPSEVTIRIFTLQGAFVWESEIEKGASGGVPGLNEVPWNGYNSRGRLVESGGYLLKIWVENERGLAVEQIKIGVLNGGR